MFQDDRMIPVLTAVLLMVVVGTFLQRAERGMDPSGPEVLQLVDDQVTAPAGALVRIDPLANDLGVTDGMRAGLTVVTSPACGRLLIRNGVFEYMAGEACSGRQTIRYTVAGAPEGQLATVTARIRGGGIPAGDEVPPAVVAAPVVPTGAEAPAVAAAGDAAAELTEAPPARSPTEAGEAPVPAVTAAARRATEAGRVPGATIAGASTAPPMPVASAAGMTGAAGPNMPIAAPPGSAAATGNPPPSDPAATDTATGSPARLATAPHATPGTVGVAQPSAPAPESPIAAPAGDGARFRPEIAAGAAVAPAGTGTPSGIAAAAPDGAVTAGPMAAAGTPGTEASAATGTGHGSDREIATAAPPVAAGSTDARSGVAGAASPEAPRQDIAAVAPQAPARAGAVRGAASGIAAAVPAGSAGDIAPGITDAATPEGASGPMVAAAAAPAGIAPRAPGAAAGPEADLPSGTVAIAADAGPELAASAPPGTEAAGTPGTDLAALNAREPQSAEGLAPARSAPARGLGSGAASARPAEGSDAAGQQVAMASVPARRGDDRDDAAASAEPEAPVLLASLAAPASKDRPALPAGAGAPVRIVSPGAMHGPTAPASSGSGAAGRPGAETPSQAGAADGRPGHAGFMMTVAGRAPYAAPPAEPFVRGAADAPAPMRPAATEPGRGAANAASNAPEVARLAPPLAEAPPAGPSPALTGFPMILPPPRPAWKPGEGEVRTARLDPAAIGGASPGAVTLGQAPPERTAPATGGTRLARLPDQTASCVTAPAMTLEVRGAGETVVSVTAPCHTATIAELSYSGLRFAVPIDAAGHGRITALGFEPNAPALLTFADGGQIDFDLPFKGVGRVSRVALAWEAPVDLALNALEYDAAPYSAGHVAPRRPRSFAQVRRLGGGWLSTYHATAGVGQNVQVYSWWHREGEEPGVVRLLVEFISRQLGAPGTCGDGAAAAPQFLVLRSDFGRPERPVLRQLAPVDCASVPPEGDQALISGAVEDLVITDR